MRDTLGSAPIIQEIRVDTLGYLKAAIVTANWVDRNKAIDRRYATGRFSWPAHFTFDLTKADLRYAYDILDYLKHQLPGGYDLPQFKGKQALFYLDEQLVNWSQLSSTRALEIAYVKVIEDFTDDSRLARSVAGIAGDVYPTFKNPAGKDNSPSAMICIYTRKDKDLRSIPGKLNTQANRGYDKPQMWNHPDRTTLFWAPYNNVNTYRFAFADPLQRSFKIVVDGVNRFGDALHFEKIVE